MKIIRSMYEAGKTIVIREQPKRKIEKGRKRAPKINQTSEEVWKNNLKYAVFRLTLLLNHNFVPGDLHLQLTYKIEPTEEQSKKDRQKFTRDLKRECKKIGIDVKWVAVTEKKGTRVHHHIICSNAPIAIIQKCWKHGIVFHNPLWDNPNYKDLAEYLLKEASKTYEEKENIRERRYNTSRNVVMPQEPREKELSRIDLNDEPKPPKGYYIDGEVEIYEHAITRMPCRQYILVPIEGEEQTRIKGRRGKYEKINYLKLLREAYTEHQESLDVF